MPNYSFKCVIIQLICGFGLTLLIPFSSFSQQINVISQLDDAVKESSGLIYLNGKIITHNDSGDEAILYELDSITGNVTRMVVIDNATNIDWEDICFDENYIYIADIGNNSGSRTNLKVYRISIIDYFSSVSDTVHADAIHYKYSDQIDFKPKTFATNYDAEAIVSWNDSLYIFTKNWLNFKSNIYALSKDPGTYDIHKIDSINSLGLVTGATYNKSSNRMMLLGYTFSEPFVLEISNIANNTFSNGQINKYALKIPQGFSYQTEGILFKNINQYYITSEASSLGRPGLFGLNLDIPVSVDNMDRSSFVIRPNPAYEIIHIEHDNFSTAQLYDMQGVLQKATIQQSINISDLSKGIYMLVIYNLDGSNSVSRISIIR